MATESADKKVSVLWIDDELVPPSNRARHDYYNTVKVYPFHGLKSDKLFDYVIGLSLPVPEFDKYIKTFRSDDTGAVEADWNSIGNDFTRCLLEALSTQDLEVRKKFYRGIAERYLASALDKFEKKAERVDQLSLPFLEGSHGREKGGGPGK